MASTMYNEYKKQIGSIDWSSALVKVMLVDATYTLNIDTHSNKSDIDGLSVELADGVGGYTAGGATLTTIAPARDDVNDWTVFDADDVTWATSTLTARGAIVYFDSLTASTSTLIAYVDFVTDKVSSSGDFIIQWHADGVFRIG